MSESQQRVSRHWIQLGPKRDEQNKRACRIWQPLGTILPHEYFEDRRHHFSEESSEKRATDAMKRWLTPAA